MILKNLIRAVLILTIVVSMVIPGAYAKQNAKPMPIIAPAPISAESQLEMMASVSVVDVKDGIVSLEIAFYLTNNGYKDVDLTFNTSQKFDYWITGDNFSYHYADGKAFLQVITPLHLKAGQTVKLGTDRVNVPYGTYELSAYLVGYRLVSVGGKLVLEESVLQDTYGAVFKSYEDIYNALQITASVKSYVVKEGDDIVAIDFYVKNTSSDEIVLSGFAFNLDILGGHASYMAYTSQYDKDQYLHFVADGTLTLAPGEEKLVASFRWDQNANVRSGQTAAVVPTYQDSMFAKGQIDYYPTYIVVLKNKPFTLSVGKFSVEVPATRYHMAFPLYIEKEVAIGDVPQWLEKYVKNIEGFIVPTSTKGIDFEAEASRNQVLWGVFMASGLNPVSVVDHVFADIKPYYYMESILQALKEKNIVKGYTDGTVRLLQPVTRAEATALMIRVLENVYDVKFDLMKRACHTFKDMTGNEWYAKYVCYAEWIGLVSGYPDGTFRGSDHIKVAEIAKMLGVMYSVINR